MAMNKEPEFQVREFKECRKGQSLQGFFVLVLPSGMVLHDMTYHQREDGAKWVGMPAKSFVKDGETAWFRLVDFVDKAAFAKFQESAKAALERFFQARDLHITPDDARAAVGKEWF
jgi:hypothetical protein